MCYYYLDPTLRIASQIASQNPFFAMQFCLFEEIFDCIGIASIQKNVIFKLLT